MASPLLLSFSAYKTINIPGLEKPALEAKL
jgi:hypothetical protein